MSANEEYAEIPLRNKAHEIIAYALVDKKNEQKVNSYMWHDSGEGYAQSKSNILIHGRKKSVLMHRFIMNAKQGDPLIDHKNGKKLDNREMNLRFSNPSENAQNQEKQLNTTSEFIGVYWAKKSNKWQVSCRKKFLGLFEDESWAGYSYDLGALEIFGAHAKINGISKPNGFIPYVLKQAPKNVEIDGKKCKGFFIIHKDKNTCYTIQLSVKGKTQRFTSKDLDVATKKYSEWKSLANTNDPVEIQRNDNGIALLPCKNTCGVLVDDDIYLKFINQSCWSTNGKDYPTVCIKGKTQKLHRIIMDAQPGELIDHIDVSKMNALRANLRKTNDSVNAHNKLKPLNSNSKYLGVSKTRSNTYHARMTKDGISYTGGTYANEEVAAFASDCLAKELYRENARSNNSQLKGYIFVNRRAVKIGEQTTLLGEDSPECLPFKKIKTK